MEWPNPRCNARARSPPKRARRGSRAGQDGAACEGVLHPANGQRAAPARAARPGAAGGYVQCPICSLSLRESFLNTHLDSCAQAYPILTLSAGAWNAQTSAAVLTFMSPVIGVLGHALTRVAPRSTPPTGGGPRAQVPEEGRRGRARRRAGPGARAGRRRGRRLRRRRPARRGALRAGGAAQAGDEPAEGAGSARAPPRVWAAHARPAPGARARTAGEGRAQRPAPSRRRLEAFAANQQGPLSLQGSVPEAEAA
jgi:hypothetical protein